MIHRTISSEMLRLRSKFPVLALTGPRQSGKTTLVRKLFADLPYATLENPETRMLAQEDPRRFLSQHPSGLVIDEAQRVPDLFSWIQGIVDEPEFDGTFVLTGSQNFLLLSSITQSLAGRVALFTLLPFTLLELADARKTELDTALLTGFYPPVYDRSIEAQDWYPGYLTTYIERDVRSLTHIGDLHTFQRFLGLTAGQAAQTLSYNALAVEVAVSQPTIKSWVSVLEASYITFRLLPYHKNFRKRLIKTPKLYFYDTGLLCYLLGIRSEAMLANHPARGAIFENFCVSEMLRHQYHLHRDPQLYFWRDRSGYEMDILQEKDGELIASECKSGTTIQRRWLQSVLQWQQRTGAPATRLRLVYGGEERHCAEDIDIVPWHEVALDNCQA